MSIELAYPEKSEYWSIVDSGGNILDSGRLTPDLVLTTNNPTIIHSPDENEFMGMTNDAGAMAEPLPVMGTLLPEGKMYSWEGQNVVVRQEHNRTEHDPDTVPALFNFYRPNAEDGAPWMTGEQVFVGTKRTFDGVLYISELEHITQTDWTPPVATTLWTVVVVTDPGDEWPVWVQPGSTNPYQMDAQVTHNDIRWISKHAANVWEPGTVGTSTLWIEA